MEEHKPTPLRELKKLRRPVSAKTLHRENFKKIDHLALWITEHIGTMGFFLIIFVWTVLWLGWNILAPESLQFDPPAFVLWLFISNLIQIFLMPLIMIGQNLANKHSEAREQADYEVNLKSELEIETVLQHLENQNVLIQQVLRRLEEKKDLTNQ